MIYDSLIVANMAVCGPLHFRYLLRRARFRDSRITGRPSTHRVAYYFATTPVPWGASTSVFAPSMITMPPSVVDGGAHDRLRR